MQAILLILAMLGQTITVPWMTCGPSGHEYCVASGGTPVQDDGYGVCPAFSHFHPSVDDIGRFPAQLYTWTTKKEAGSWPDLDGLCHRDEDDSPIVDRKVLPKFHPDPDRNWL